MNKNHFAVQATAALQGADPVRDFLQTIPGKARILGLKVYHTGEKNGVMLSYFWNAETVTASFFTKGGPI